VARRSVEQDQGSREQEEERHEQRQKLVGEAARPVLAESAARRFGALGDGDGLGHQKAWPSETVTATGPSPFWRFSGTPKSTRIGPKLE